MEPQIFTIACLYKSKTNEKQGRKILEARFKSQALLDEKAFLMTPVLVISGYEGDCGCVDLQQWRKPRTRIRELIKLGVSKREAIMLGLSRKSYWRLSKTLATNAGLSIAHFESIGLISMRTLWCKIHHPATAR